MSVSRRPIARLIPRREVLAFIALHGTEEAAPNQVNFREYEREGQEWHCIDLAVDTPDAVRFWAQTFGHAESRYRVQKLSDETLYHSSHDTWRGWRVKAECFADSVADTPLDDDTREQLAALAEPDAQEPA